MDPPPAEHSAPTQEDNPPTKRLKVDPTVTVVVGGVGFAVKQNVFSRLEGFIADKIARSEKKAR